MKIQTINDITQVRQLRCFKEAFAPALRICDKYQNLLCWVQIIKLVHCHWLDNASLTSRVTFKRDKVSKGAKIRRPYNQVPHLTQE